jgi:hypothetical protein
VSAQLAAFFQAGLSVHQEEERFLVVLSGTLVLNLYSPLCNFPLLTSPALPALLVLPELK